MQYVVGIADFLLISQCKSINANNRLFFVAEIFYEYFWHGNCSQI